MILIVTLNPLLEKRLFFNDIILGKVHRSNIEVLKAGGKGINVNRQLNVLGIKNHALTFLGGTNGRILRKILLHEEINFTSIHTDAETRYATLSIEESKKRITSFFSPQGEINEKEVEEFKSKLEKMIKNCSIVIFAGSSPSQLTDSIFPFGIETANKLDKISILDTYGRHYSSCLEKCPFAVHNNTSEIENSLNMKLDNEKLKLDFLNFLYANNVKMGFLTEGSQPVYTSKFNFHYKISPPNINKIDETGSGDAFVAGISYGLEKSLVFDELCSIATSLGAANAASWDVCNTNTDELEKYNEKIKFEPIGKQMKLIDDSPNF